MTRFIALFVALVAGVGVAVWYYRVPADGVPTAIVRNDDRWLDDLQSRSPKDVEQATALLEERGTAALPVIRRTLQDPAADPARRQAALKATAILGARAAEAIPDVAAALQEPDYAPEAALALSFMGSAAVPALQDAIKSSDAIVRREVAARAGQAARARVDRSTDRGAAAAARNRGRPDPSVSNVAVNYLGIVRDDPGD